MSRIAVLLSIAICLSACGQTGKLYLPEKSQPAVTSVPSDNASNSSESSSSSSSSSTP